MNFLEVIINNLERTPEKVILSEVHESGLVSTSCRQLYEAVTQVRSVLQEAGLQRGDRCALLAPNSSRWVALDLAIMAEGGIVVPLYARQSPAELAAMMQDCAPKLLVCADEELKQSIFSAWPDAPKTLLYDEMFPSDAGKQLGVRSPVPLSPDSPVAIIYTSGTSGDAKGVVLNVGNLTFMVQRTTARLDELMAGVPKDGDDRVFHYLPFCFAGSWILLLTCLYRSNALMMSMDLNRLADELKVATPHYLLNVPALLDRIRNGIVGQLRKKGGLALALFERGQVAWLARRNQRGIANSFWLILAKRLVFPKIRQHVGPNLVALISGSAPLSEETQLFFMMLGISVLQVYGLTETTAICTMDDVHDYSPGRVGPAISGIEMKAGENHEILVRGPNVFPGYWNRPETTAQVLKDGWFHTGDQGEADEKGNWKIVGRLKDLIIPSSGHNISPEPIEQMVLSELPGAEHVMAVGNGRKFLSMIITGGNLSPDQIEAALSSVNRTLPHYKQIRRFFHSAEPFTVENGLLTANRKLKRTLIEGHFRSEIESLYATSSDLERERVLQ